MAGLLSKNLDFFLESFKDKCFICTVTFQAGGKRYRLFKNTSAEHSSLANTLLDFYGLRNFGNLSQAAKDIYGICEKCRTFLKSFTNTKDKFTKLQNQFTDKGVDGLFAKLSKSQTSQDSHQDLAVLTSQCIQHFDERNATAKRSLFQSPTSRKNINSPQSLKKLKLKSPKGSAVPTSQCKRQYFEKRNDCVKRSLFQSPTSREDINSPTSLKKLKLTPISKLKNEETRHGSPKVTVVTKYPSSHKVSSLQKHMKVAVSALAQNRYATAIRYLMKDPRFSKQLFKKIFNLINSECSQVCHPKSKSILRSSNDIENFNFDAILSELQTKLPFTYHYLAASIGLKSNNIMNSKKKLKLSFVYSLLMKCRNSRMDQVSKVLGVLMYKAKCRTKLFRRFNSLGISTSHKTILSFIDDLAVDHDEQVKGWQEKLQDQVMQNFDHTYTKPWVIDPHTEEKQALENHSYLTSGDLTDLTKELKTAEPLLHTLTSCSPMDMFIDTDGSFVFEVEIINEPTEVEKNYMVENTLNTCHNTDNLETMCEQKMPIGAGFQIVFDNLNLDQKVRHKTKENSNNHIDLVHAIAIKDRVNVENLPDDKAKSDILKCPNHKWFLTAEEHSVIKESFIVLVERSLVMHMECFHNWPVTQHMEHLYSSEMKQKSEIVPLGILNKNEAKTEDMIDILTEYQKYCPKSDENLHPILTGGDGLTVRRGEDAKLARCDSSTSEDRLEGVILKSEDWHEQVICLQDVFNNFYDAKSVGEKGTLYQLREYFDRRGVRKDVHNSVHDSREFLRFVTYGYITLAAMTELDITDQKQFPPNLPTSEEGQKQFLQNLALKIVNKFVLFHYTCPNDILANEPEIQTEEDQQQTTSGRILCGYVGCKKSFKEDSHHRARHRQSCPFQVDLFDIDSEPQRPMRLRKVPCGYNGCNKMFTKDGVARTLHRKNCTFKHNSVPHEETVSNTITSENEDYKWNYVTSLLREGLLDWAHDDATKEGDGPKLYLLWKYDFLKFKAGGHTNYSILAFQFIAQVEALLSERRAAQLIHNRTVNLYGGVGHNMANDYALELKNGEVKPDLKSKGSKLTDKTIDRIGKSLRKTEEVTHNFDKNIQFYSSIGRHGQTTFKKDVEVMVKMLCREDLFQKSLGRKFKSFPLFPKNSINKIDGNKFNKWIDNQKQKTSVQQRNFLYGYKL